MLIFRNKWYKTLKVNNWKLWREQTRHIGMLEKNRLNDSLYQISVESQTMKEKLKMQEKILKNNLSMYEELRRKKE
jgi:hypothetical protein